MPTPWPALPLETWKETYGTLHMATQVVGKIRLALSPPENHWWHVPLYVTARGLTTGPIPHGDRTFELTFDFFEHQLVVATSRGEVRHVPLGPVPTFYADVMATLEKLGLPVSIWPMPVEVPDPTPFDRDHGHCRYDGEAARIWFQILRRVDMVFKRFKGDYPGKVSPVHFFWGSFDLAVTRFSGRAAEPKAGADAITREAYNAELASLGFWPGGAPGVEDAAFYAYCYPEPEGYREAARLPEGAFYHETLGEYLLPYAVVRQAADPAGTILAFAQGTYEAAARLQRWPEQARAGSVVWAPDAEARVGRE